MQISFEKKKISGVLAVLPETEALFDDEVGQYEFPVEQTAKLKRIMGYDRHRLAKTSSTASDFCIFGLRHMLANGMIQKEEIGAIVTVGVVPDYFMPHIGNIIHGECDLAQDTIAVDMSQGCCGFLMGLLQGYSLLEHLQDKKVLLFNSDVLSHKTSKKDRNSFPIVGDITTISVLENAVDAKPSYFNLKMDGSRRNALKIPAGGGRLPSTIQTAELQPDKEGNYRSLDNLVMDGTAVFQFVQKDVPPMIDETLTFAGKSKEEIDWYLFHQPNRFMLQKLADRICVPREKVPMGIVEKYGNPSGASIPLVMASAIREELLTEMRLCCLSAFGSGLAWGAAIVELGNLNHCEMIESNL